MGGDKMRLMCVKCSKFMEVEKIGVKVRPKGYEGAFHADLLKCPKCGSEVLVLADTEDPSCIGQKVDYDFSS